MAIFAKKKRGTKGGGKGNEGSSARATTGDRLDPATAPPALNPRATEEGPATDPPQVGTPVALAEDLAVEETQVVGPTLVESPVANAVVASGVVQPAIVDPVEFEAAEVIEPEAVEANGEDSATPAFGIEDAVRLMRSLPVDSSPANSSNAELVVRVVRVTLDALHVDIEDVIQDATRKERVLRDSIAALETQAQDLAKQLEAKRLQIATHQADLRETAVVRERLHLAENHAGHRPPPTPRDAAKHAPSVGPANRAMEPKGAGQAKG